MENSLWSEGHGKHKGFFAFTLMPHTNTSKVLNYTHSNKHTIEYDLNYA